MAGPKAVPALMDQKSFEHIVVCALILAIKMHQGDNTSNVSHRLSPLTSSPLTPRALCDLEFRMMGALGRHLNPPTAGTLIHHLLHFLPEREDKELLLTLDDHANDLALMALETPDLASFPVSVIAVAAVLASLAHLRASGAVFEGTLELRWLQALEANGLTVSHSLDIQIYIYIHHTYEYTYIIHIHGYSSTHIANKPLISHPTPLSLSHTHL